MKKRFLTQQQLKDQGFEFCKTVQNGPKQTISVYAHEADLFEMRFIVNRKFGEVLNEEDLETVNGFFEWHCMSDEEAKLLD